MNDLDFVMAAIFSIRPKAEFTVGETYDSLNWLSADQGKPTEAEFDTALANFKLQYSGNEYARNRASATGYPTLADQFDMQYHDQLDGTTTWKDAVAKVKSDNPKPDGWKE